MLVRINDFLIMKNVVLLLFVFFPMFMLAQNLSVYGISLGDNKNKITNVLVAKGKEISYDTSDSGKQFLRITSPKIGDVTYRIGNFYFDKNNRLNKVVFAQFGDGGYGDPNGAWVSGFQLQVNACEKIFITMYENLKLKYGAPRSSSKNNIIWQKGNQRITLEWAYRYDRDQSGWIHHEVRTGLVYEIIDINTSDF